MLVATRWPELVNTRQAARQESLASFRVRCCYTAESRAGVIRHETVNCAVVIPLHSGRTALYSDANQLLTMASKTCDHNPVPAQGYGPVTLSHSLALMRMCQPVLTHRNVFYAIALMMRPYQHTPPPTAGSSDQLTILYRQPFLACLSSHRSVPNTAAKNRHLPRLPGLVTLLLSSLDMHTKMLSITSCACTKVSDFQLHMPQLQHYSASANPTNCRSTQHQTDSPQTPPLQATAPLRHILAAADMPVASTC